MFNRIKIFSSVSLESVFPVKHNHVGDSFDNDQLCEGLNANEVEPLYHTDIFPNNSFFFKKAYRSIDGVPFIQVQQTMSTYKLSRNFVVLFSYH